MHFVEIDIGTTSICGIIYDFEKRKIESVTKDNDSKILSKNIWEKIQDPQKILFKVEEIITGFMQKYSQIKGIGITGQMHGILYIDNDGNALSPLFTWQDGRSNALFNNCETYLEILKKSSDFQIASGFGLGTHFYNQKK